MYFSTTDFRRNKYYKRMQYSIILFPTGALTTMTSAQKSQLQEINHHRISMNQAQDPSSKGNPSNLDKDLMIRIWQAR